MWEELADLVYGALLRILFLFIFFIFIFVLSVRSNNKIINKIKLDTVINSFSANHAYLKTLCKMML